jgi:hypothetical protein
VWVGFSPPCLRGGDLRQRPCGRPFELAAYRRRISRVRNRASAVGVELAPSATRCRCEDSEMAVAHAWGSGWTGRVSATAEAIGGATRPSAWAKRKPTTS